MEISFLHSVVRGGIVVSGIKDFVEYTEVTSGLVILYGTNIEVRLEHDACQRFTELIYMNTLCSVRRTNIY